jgi:predicted GNAT family acetyltransferase
MPGVAKIITCSECGKTAKNRGFMRCSTCYLRHRINKIRVICSVCNQDTPHYGKGMCAKCHSYTRKQTPEYKAKHNEQVKTKYRENPEIAKNRERIRRSKEEVISHNHEQQRIYYQENKEKIIAYQISYRKENRLKINNLRRAYRNRQRGLKADLTETQWQEILKAHDYSCAYCGTKTVQYFHREHKIPASKGGHFTASNIVPSCGSCNSRKHTKTDAEFREFLKASPC